MTALQPEKSQSSPIQSIQSSQSSQVDPNRAESSRVEQSPVARDGPTRGRALLAKTEIPRRSPDWVTNNHTMWCTPTLRMSFRVDTDK